MHIPDGYLGPPTYLTLWAIMVPLWSWAGKQTRKMLQARHVPLLALAAAFSFVIMMFNIPAPGGTTGHAVGAALAAIALGPWNAVIAISIALIVQALLFGDGGITAIGANCFNMAFAMPMTAWGVYRLFCGENTGSMTRRMAAAALAAYVSLNVAALLTALELGLQPLIAHRPDGTPLYCPYSWKAAVPVMAMEHLFFFGWVEAIVTALILRYFWTAGIRGGAREEPRPGGSQNS